MTEHTIRKLDTPTPEAYRCAVMGCAEPAVEVRVVQTRTMPAPAFYGRCQRHAEPDDPDPE